MAPSRNKPSTPKHRVHHMEQPATRSAGRPGADPGDGITPASASSRLRTHDDDDDEDDGRRHHHQKAPARHPILPRQPSTRTRYVDMLLHLDEIPRLHNVLAAFFSWILLAAWVVLPGTFTSLAGSLRDSEALGDSAAARAVLNGVGSVPLLVVAAVCCGVGVLGTLWLAARWRRNYVWLLNRLYLPGIASGLAGLIATLVGVYAHQHGEWSLMAKIAAVAEGVCVGTCGALFVVYNQVLLSSVRRRHERHEERWGVARGSDEGLREKIERKAKEPALEPGSVV